MTTREIIFKILMDNSNYIYDRQNGFDGQLFNMSLTDLSKEIDEKLKENREQEEQRRSIQDESSMAYEVDISDSSFDTEVSE